MAQHFTFARFGQSDGLYDQDVSSIVQDHAGIVWLGTENGVFQMDGSRSLPVRDYHGSLDGAVLAMNVDTKGRVWILGASRLVYFTPDGVIHRIAGFVTDMMLNDGGELATLPSQPDTVYVLHDNRLLRVDSADGGTSWTTRHVFSPGQAASEPALTMLHGLAAQPSRSALWTGCGDAICEIHPGDSPSLGDATSVSRWDHTRGVPSGDWSAFLLSRDGAIWSRSTSGTLRIETESMGVEQMGNPAASPADVPRRLLLCETSRGVIATNLADGLAFWQAGQWHLLRRANGLPPTEITAMNFDRGGAFWLSAVGTGVWRWLGYANWQALTEGDGLSNDVIWGIVRGQDDDIWVGNSAGVDRLVQGQQGWTVDRAASFHPPGGALSMAADTTGRVWTASLDGRVAMIDPQRRTMRAVPSDAGAVYQILDEPARPNSDERVWLCTARGAGYLSAADNWQQVHLVTAAGAPTSRLWSVTEDPAGNLWFAGHHSLYRLSAGVWKRIELPAALTEIDYGLLRATSDGSLWMQSADPHPLVRLRVEGNRVAILETVTNASIGSDDIQFIRTDDRGWLWIGTDRGIYVRQGTRWVQCTTEDGLISNDTDTNAIWIDGDGSLWFGTVQGLSHLLHPEVLFATGAPRLSIRSVSLNGEPLRANVSRSFGMHRPELRAQLFSTEYRRSRAIQFRFQLRGRDNRWITTDDGDLHFAELPPGDYRLVVQAIDVRAHRVSAPVEYPFTLLPPWYERGVTRALAFLLLLSLIGIGWRMSVIHLKNNEALLKRKVDEQTAQLLAEKAELERAQAELVQIARKDSLTGLLNRSAIFEILGALGWQALAHNTPLTVIMADLDHFKSINDRFGHGVGDAVLIECAERFRDVLRPADAIGRYGGEELLIVIPGLQPTQAVSRIEAIRAAIAEKPVIHGDHRVQVTCSFGVAWLDEQNPSIESVLTLADAALYMAKQLGRNRVHFAPGPVDQGLLLEQI